MTTRSNRSAPWGTPLNVGSPINGPTLDISPTMSSDSLTLVFTSNNRSGGIGSWDLWMSTRASVQDPWNSPVNLGPAVNSGAWDGECGLSWDGRVVFFDSGRAGIAGAVDLWVSTRKTLADTWAVAANLGPIVNSSGNDGTARVSPDLRTLYFCSDRLGGFGSYDLLEAPIIPVVDLNGDGIVDAADICIMINHWHTANPLCDIGPAPWGDGIVDVQDLVVLAEHLFEEVFPIELAAYWKLDETEGIFAHNSISDNHGVLSGNPTWQPDSGQKGGALEFDGIDDYIETDFILNPTDGAFSVFAWIKGGAPGQAIISQADGTGSGETWLGITLDGRLMSGLVPPKVGRSVIFPLESQSLITDGLWHHVGFVWDSAYRSLYMDGTEVARDTHALTLAPLKSATGGLHIGADKTLGAGTFFSGLIDDVRIYNVALSTEKIAALAQ